MRSTFTKRETIFPGSRARDRYVLSRAPESMTGDPNEPMKVRSNQNTFKQTGDNVPFQDISTVLGSAGQKHPPPAASFDKEHDTAGSPWDNYEKLFQLQFGAGEYVVVCEKLSGERGKSKLAMIQTLSGPNIERQMQLLQCLEHPNIVPLQSRFLDTSHFAEFEFMPLSLVEIMANPLLNELRLASILGQVLCGLEFLEQNGFIHGNLKSSNILINCEGTVKLCKWFETRQYVHHGGLLILGGCNNLQRKSDKCYDIRALSLILMELMQGSSKEGGGVGIDDVKRWPPDSLAVNFLLATTYVTDLSQLQKVCKLI